ncbi:MAG: protein kinase [Deltaproteobacteria bacterium]|nr:protein kinase [Deltaproteobacteria bacterium]
MATEHEPEGQKNPSKLLRRGSRLGKYRLDRRLGRGAFSEVWKARDTLEQRHIAVKIASPESVHTFGRCGVEHEAMVSSRLLHPHILRFHNADWIDGHFVLTTELAARSLAAYPGARRSPRIALQVLREVASGLAHAHSNRVLHLDVKPENVLLLESGRAVLADFGVSRIAANGTRTYTEAGTLGYMAPEQAYGHPRFASDVFSLGLIAYEILSGMPATWPFTWPLPGHERFQARVPEPIQPVIKKAISFDSKQRYRDGIALHEALEAAFRRVESSSRRGRQRRNGERPPIAPLALEAALFARHCGNGLDLRYTCHRCSGPIAEAMSHCPWCGSPDNSFIQVSRYELVCPDCERGVHPEWGACPWCYSGRFASNGRKPRKDPKATRRCTHKGCEGQIQPFMRYCPECKQKVRRLWSHPALPDRCKRCRWPVSRASWRYCPWCGRREPKAGTFESMRRVRRQTAQHGSC